MKNSTIQFKFNDCSLNVKPGADSVIVNSSIGGQGLSVTKDSKIILSAKESNLSFNVGADGSVFNDVINYTSENLEKLSLEGEQVDAELGAMSPLTPEQVFDNLKETIPMLQNETASHIAQREQFLDTLVSLSGKNTPQYKTMFGQLEDYKNVDDDLFLLNKEISSTTDPVKKSQLIEEYDRIKQELSAIPDRVYSDVQSGEEKYSETGKMER